MRTGIVTGGGSGFGAAISRELASLGMRVVVADLDAARAQEVADAIVAAGGSAVATGVDVRRLDDVARAVALCREQGGRVDFAVANAGVGENATLVDADPARWQVTLDVNLLGVAHTVRAVLPTMLEQGDGHIVLTASVSGRVAYSGEPVYIASKWGVVGLGEALRQETVGTGVRVTLVEPGLVDTPLARAHPFAGDWLGKIVPLQPEDVARAVVWALAQPPHLAVNEVVLRPAAQEI